MKLQQMSHRRHRTPMMWLSWPVSQEPARKKPRATPMLPRMNISPFSSGRMIARVRNIVLPVWLDAKQW